jgi:hypothetical protein
MLGRTYTYETKKYNAGDILTTYFGREYKVINNLGIAFKEGRKSFYKLEVELIKE